MMIQKKVKYIAFPPSQTFQSFNRVLFLFCGCVVSFIYYFFRMFGQRTICEHSAIWILVDFVLRLLQCLESLSFQMLFDNNNLLLFPVSSVQIVGRLLDDVPTSDLFGFFLGGSKLTAKKKTKKSCKVKRE